jgi:hypothetical protein
MATSSFHRQPEPTPAGQRPLIDAYAVAELVATGDADNGTGPVPVTMWRIAQPDRTVLGYEDTNDGSDGHLPSATFDAVLAGMIVASYARGGQLILSLGHDPDLAGAAGAAGCRYRPVTSPADLADLDHVAGQVPLIVLPWPPAGHDNAVKPEALRDMFAACRLLLARDGVTCVTLTADPVSDGYDQHGSALIQAADINGLDLVNHILAVTESVTGRHGHLRLSTTALPVSLFDRLALAIRRHVLLFVLGGGHHD